MLADTALLPWSLQVASLDFFRAGPLESMFVEIIFYGLGQGMHSTTPPYPMGQSSQRSHQMQWDPMAPPLNAPNVNGFVALSTHV